MIRARALACSSDFLLRLAGCQGKHSIAEARRAALAASRSCSPGGGAPTRLRWRRRLGWRCRRLGWRCRRLGYSSPCWPRALAVAREHTRGRLQFAELGSELLALCIDACKCLTDLLLLLGDLIQCRHTGPSRQ